MKMGWITQARRIFHADYLHLFLGAIGYPIQIADIGQEAAEQAFAFANQHRSQRAGA